jgi:glucose/arabinose dehydrogenase
MFKSRRNIFLAVVITGFLAVAGCSNQEQTPPQAKKAAPAKPANRPASSPAPAPSQSASAKPASGKAATAKPVSAKVSAPIKMVTVPKGTFLTTTLAQPLASNKNKVGDSFAATLTSSVKVNGKTVIPKGAHVTGKVVTAKKKGPAGPELTVALASIDFGGKSYPLSTNSVGPADRAKSKASSDNSDKPKNITVAAQTHLKFKLAKSAKVPASVKS